MFLIMIIQLFTVRIVLNTLGVVDYGINNVVGGIVAMFSFLSNTMASASQRFFSYEIGKNDLVKLKNTFSLTITIYIIIAIIVFILAESVGLWFLNKHMTIPSERVVAANFVYQFSILSFIVTILTIPYNASITAHENMKIYAYVSIVEVVLKLIIVAFLVYFTFDKLKLYSILMFGVTLIISLSYKIVSSRLYKECRFNLYWNKKMFSEIMSYSGWNLLGVLSGIIKNQGINILLNIFFGPIVNAARGIAYQINSVVNQFVINFFKSIEPQIIKYYAVENKNKMLSLVFQGSKISYFLLLFITLPVLFETEFILTIWLQKIPEYVIIFTRLVILTSLLDSLSYSLTTAALATGKIKMYQIVVGGILLFNLPVSYLLLKVGFGPEITMIIAFGISFIALFIRILMLNKMVGLNILNYLKDVLLKVLFTSFLITLLPSIFYLTMGQGFLRLSIVLFSCFTMGFIFIYFVGLTFNERNYINELFKNKFVLKSVK